MSSLCSFLFVSFCCCWPHCSVLHLLFSMSLLVSLLLFSRVVVRSLLALGLVFNECDHRFLVHCFHPNTLFQTNSMAARTQNMIFFLCCCCCRCRCLLLSKSTAASSLICVCICSVHHDHDDDIDSTRLVCYNGIVAVSQYHTARNGRVHRGNARERDRDRHSRLQLRVEMACFFEKYEIPIDSTTATATATTTAFLRGIFAIVNVSTMQ